MTSSLYRASTYFGLFPFRIDTKMNSIHYSRSIFFIGAIIFPLSLVLQFILVFGWEPNSDVESFVVWLGDLVCTVSAFVNFISCNYYRFERKNLLTVFDKEKSVSYKLIKTIDTLLLILFCIVLIVQLILYFYLYSYSLIAHGNSFLLLSNMITCFYDILALFCYTEFINMVLAIYVNLLSLNSELQEIIASKCVRNVQNSYKRYCSISQLVNRLIFRFMKSKRIKYIV